MRDIPKAYAKSHKQIETLHGRYCDHVRGIVSRQARSVLQEFARKLGPYRRLVLSEGMGVTDVEIRDGRNPDNGYWVVSSCDVWRSHHDLRGSRSAPRIMRRFVAPLQELLSYIYDIEDNFCRMQTPHVEVRGTKR